MTDGLVGRKVGGIRRLCIPAALAHGDCQRANIPACSDVVFDVQLVAVT